MRKLADFKKLTFSSEILKPYQLNPNINFSDPKYNVDEQ